MKFIDLLKILFRFNFYIKVFLIELIGKLKNEQIKKNPSFV